MKTSFELICTRLYCIFLCFTKFKIQCYYFLMLLYVCVRTVFVYFHRFVSNPILLKVIHQKCCWYTYYLKSVDEKNNGRRPYWCYCVSKSKYSGVIRYQFSTCFCLRLYSSLVKNYFLLFIILQWVDLIYEMSRKWSMCS